MAFPYSAGDVLTAADLNASSGLVHIKSQTIGSGVSSVTVSNCFSSTFDNYRVVVHILSTTSTGSDVILRMDNVSTGYYGSLLRDLYSGGLTGYVRMNNASGFSVGQLDSTWQAAVVSVDVYAPNLNLSTHVTGNYFGRGYSGFFAGAMNQAVHTGLTLLPGSGTMTGGTIRVYGYNNG